MSVKDALKGLGSELAKVAVDATAAAKAKAGALVAEAKDLGEKVIDNAAPTVTDLVGRAKVGAETALTEGRNVVAGAATKVADAVRTDKK